MKRTLSPVEGLTPFTKSAVSPLRSAFERDVPRHDSPVLRHFPTDLFPKSLTRQVLWSDEVDATGHTGPTERSHGAVSQRGSNTTAPELGINRHAVNVTTAAVMSAQDDPDNFSPGHGHRTHAGIAGEESKDAPAGVTEPWVEDRPPNALGPRNIPRAHPPDPEPNGRLHRTVPFSSDYHPSMSRFVVICRDTS